jgi:hypothetical protein
MMSEKIDLVLVRRHKKKAELAREAGWKTPALYAKLRRDNLTEQEAQKIAEVLNCTLEINFILNDTGEKF